MGGGPAISDVTVVAVSGSAGAGAPRVATTLAERSGAFLVGDLRQIWTRGLRDDQPCGCGDGFRACAFWREVGQTAFGGWDRVDGVAVAALFDAAHRPAGIAALLRQGGRSDAARYGRYADRIVGAVSSLTGAHLVVALAKNPYQGFVLARTPQSRTRWVHVVRDPRSIAWLWMTGTTTMKAQDRLSFTTGGVVYKWARYNTIVPALARLGHVPYLRVAFEDVLGDPDRTLARIAGFATGDAKATTTDPGERHGFMVLDRDTGPCRLVEADHRNSAHAAVAGIAREDQWREHMPALARIAVTAGTLPITASFGYLRRGHALGVGGPSRAIDPRVWRVAPWAELVTDK